MGGVRRWLRKMRKHNMLYMRFGKGADHAALANVSKWGPQCLTPEQTNEGWRTRLTSNAGEHKQGETNKLTDDTKLTQRLELGTQTKEPTKNLTLAKWALGRGTEKHGSKPDKKVTNDKVHRTLVNVVLEDWKHRTCWRWRQQTGSLLGKTPADKDGMEAANQEAESRELGRNVHICRCR